MSTHQMSLYLKLLLGLPILVPADSVSSCPCCHTHDFHGNHGLNCKHHTGRANRAAHDLVQQALKRELQLLSLHVVGNDNDKCQQFSHLSSQKRGDLAILSAHDYLIYYLVFGDGNRRRQQRPATATQVNDKAILNRQQ